jgi:cysteinyl-tRNA synthetase
VISLNEVYKLLPPALDKKVMTVQSQSTKDIIAQVLEQHKTNVKDAKRIAHLFDAVKAINSANDGKLAMTNEDIQELKMLFDNYCLHVMGLQWEEEQGGDQLSGDLMNVILDLRAAAKGNKDYATSDKIRDALTALQIEVKDTKEGVTWEVKSK